MTTPQISEGEIPKCAVDGCDVTAVCLLGIQGEWFPICEAHAVNKLLPRRNFMGTSDESEPAKPL